MLKTGMTAQKLLFRILIVLFFPICTVVLGQKSEQFSFDELEKEILKAKWDNKKCLDLYQKEIQKAKINENKEHLFSAYYGVLNYCSPENKIKYSDSLITLGMKMGDKKAIGLAYWASSSVRLLVYQYAKALDQALIAHDYLKKIPYRDDDRILLLNIAEIRHLLGNTKEAKKIAQECYDTYKRKANKYPQKTLKYYYVYSAISLIKYNASLHLFKQNKVILKELGAFIKRNENVADYSPSVIKADAYNLYCMGKYKEAIEKLDLAYEKYMEMEKGVEKPHLWIKFYKGMCYWKMGEEEKALPYFTEIKEDYLKKGNTSIEYKPFFEFFIHYYKVKNNIKEQSKYMQYYIDYQEKNQQDLKLLLDKIHKEYDKETLKQEKAKLDKIQEHHLLKYALLGGVTLCLLSAWFWIRRKKTKTQPSKGKIENTSLDLVLKDEEQEIEQKVQQENEKTTPIDYEAYAPINRKTVDYLLGKLLEFEQEKAFLASNTRLSTLAEDFNTNRKYLSKVIKVSRGNSFNDYLNALRLAYLEELLKTDKELKTKSIREICDLLGYASPESFHTLFREHFGCPPKEYMETPS